ncbi:hypothetical protein HO173_002496 [Letharia columbiana]|uniref:Uncharacterized protein n=1 Tax=Letharia columbiana TaxID=112416 RepID=A0A8H6G2A0_9LECA|nr:uncharacterized protein HO173_002496 [Letharia columbiana]KAF6239235.1 hypothetical protein HO173_002496 [Letharia columbiana]
MELWSDSTAIPFRFVSHGPPPTFWTIRTDLSNGLLVRTDSGVRTDGPRRWTDYGSWNGFNLY